MSDANRASVPVVGEWEGARSARSAPTDHPSASTDDGAPGGFMLAAIPAPFRSVQPGHRWLLTPDALVTTNLTVSWNDIVAVRRTGVRYPNRFRSGWQHILGVTLRDDAEPAGIQLVSGPKGAR